MEESVICRLRCSGCSSWATIALPAESKAREVLDVLSCPTCGRRGAMRFAPLPVLEERAAS